MSTTNPTNITTQWEDQMVKRGIWAPKEQEKKNEELYKERIDALESMNFFENAKLDKLTDVDVHGDEDFENELNAIRAKRIEAMKSEAKENKRFGELYFIRKTDFVREVTEGSKDNTTVVVHLFKESNQDCQIINQLLSEPIARVFGKIKFVKGVSNDIVPNYPDKSLPTMIIYRNGTSIAQIAGAANFKDRDGRVTVNSLLRLFVRNGVIKSSELEGFPTLGRTGDDLENQSNSDTSEDSNDERDNGKCYSSLAFDKTQERVKYLQKI
ncbi:Phosducin related thioredoxin fold protein [Cryptosporidium felis]|nr:Phosducin related thioredoxin fold protein [Cryptosporidium felis]